MRADHRCLRLLWFAAVFLLLPGAWRAGAARDPGLALTVGHGWAVVTETRDMRLVRGEQVIDLEDIPAEADLSTLTITARRVPLRVMDWARMDPTPEPRASSLVLEEGADQVVYTPVATSPPRASTQAGSSAVMCRLESPLGGKRQLTLSYVVRGFDWSASYQIIVRGELAEDTEPLSVDLQGSARVTNPTSRVFEDAHVVLVGRQDRAGGPAKKAPGFLMLGEGPLSALWHPPEVQPAVEYVYDLKRRADLGARGKTDVPMTQRRRTPAERVYVMASAQFPIGGGAMKPLRKVIAFKNAPSRGETTALPPGEGRIYLGSRRSQLLQEGDLPRTSAGEEIRVDLGKAEGVRGKRVAGGRSQVQDGYYEDAVEIVLQNERDSSVRIEIEEEPPIQLRWSVTRATARHQVVDGRLRFSPTLQPRTEKRIFYRLRIQQPSL